MVLFSLLYLCLLCSSMFMKFYCGRLENLLAASSGFWLGLFVFPYTRCNSLKWHALIHLQWREIVPKRLHSRESMLSIRRHNHRIHFTYRWCCVGLKFLLTRPLLLLFFCVKLNSLLVSYFLLHPISFFGICAWFFFSISFIFCVLFRKWFETKFVYISVQVIFYWRYL